MAGLVPAIHVFGPHSRRTSKSWMPRTSLGMTVEGVPSLIETLPAVGPMLFTLRKGDKWMACGVDDGSLMGKPPTSQCWLLN